MTTNAKAAIVAGVTVLAAAGLWRLSDGGPSIETPSLGQANEVPAAVRVPANIERPAAPDAVEVPAREEVEARVVTADEPALASPLTLVVHGRAVGMKGEPLVGVRVGAGDDSSEGWGRTDAGGLFEVSLSRSPEEDWTAESKWLVVRDEDWITVRKSRVRSGNEQLPHLVVAAPVGSLEGWVEDSAGRPVAGARLSLSPQDKTLFGFPFALDLTRHVSLSVRSDAGGRFSFERFPEAVGLRLHVQAVGYESNDVDLDGSARPLVVWVSRSEESDSVFLEGLVLDRTGFSVEGARVHLASASAVTDSEGWFRVLVSGVGPSTPLCAGREGHLPAIVPNFGAVIEAAGGRPEPVELVLGSAPVEIRGRVEDRSGEPCADWLVSATDETEISQNMVPVTTAEGWARGSSEPVRTQADGSFRLTGLFERDYVVQAYDPATLLRAEGVLRGGDAPGRLVADRTTRTVRGVAVSRDGEPLADIRITVRLDVVETDCCSQSIPGPALVTDETGAFSFENVPARYVHLTYSGEGVLPGRHLFDPERWDGEPVEDLELELTRRCHFRLELSDFSDTADRAVFLNEDGERLQVNRIDAGGMSGFPWALLVDGNSEVLSVAETATTVVLRQGETDLARRDVHLEPSEVTVLRF